ncbi:DUF4091 domain-containing protein [Paenibacillus sp. LHD-117]|uniref:DUF4091 domain-containing protein n=1 Tax=Paenibacillus sp. LHD-117 TaxID=3071412 RepID=UPI0027E1B41A|nr:DUF4091 domain-containing protein [Paenibacillus sp. LHD-117]MDQ6421860.1 DUF4091 domain-containing protein [Paenibacillus sp. LHD-117]
MSIRWRVCDAFEWLYPDLEPAGEEGGNIVLEAASGTYAGCQLWWDGVTAGTKVEWMFQSGASSEDGSLLECCSLYELRSVRVEENTGPDYSTVPVGTDAPYTTRPAPFRVYDALKPIGSSFLTGPEGMALYVCWHIPEMIRPGTHTGALRLTIGSDNISIPVRIGVHGAVVPSAGSLSVTNWFSLSNIAKWHGLELWSEPFWEMTAKYGEAMRRARQTHFLVGMELTDIRRSDEGRYEFGFAKAERLIRMFLKLGFTRIEGGHLAGRNGWDDLRFVLSYDRSVMATGPEGAAFLSQYLKAWRTFLDSNGWLALTAQHIADEPIAESAEDYRVLSGIFRKWMPGVPLIDAVIHPELDGALDIWVPTNRDFERHMADYERLRDYGDEVWFYTCWNPGGYYLNRFLDLPLLKTRYLHWGNYLYGLNGYLHWGFNYCLKGQDPFESNNPMLAPGVHGKRVPAGDTHIVYPGDDGPWLSMRLEAMRMGVEDYELLRMAAARKPDLADEIVGSCMTSFAEVELSISHFKQAYRRLLKAASGTDAIG